MPKKNSDEEQNYKKAAGANFKKIRESLGLQQLEFYNQYLKPIVDPEDKITDVLSQRQFLGRLERGQGSTDIRILLMYSKLANISINDLYTKTIGDSQKSLHSIVSALFTILEETPLEVNKCKKGYHIQLSKQKRLNITATMLESLNTEFDNVLKSYTDSADEEQCIRYIIVEFLKEYRAYADSLLYKQWKQLILGGSQSYTIDGQLIEQSGSNDAVNKLIDGSKAEMSEDFKARLKEYAQEFENWKTVSNSDSAEEFTNFKSDLDNSSESVKKYYNGFNDSVETIVSHCAVAEEKSKYAVKRKYDDLGQMTVYDLFKEILKSKADKD